MSPVLADAILVFHFGIAAFITLGFVLIPAGAALRWRWVRNRRLRLAHLFAITFVAAEAIAGVTCPLTLWEDALRGRAAGGAGFIERWVGRLLYYDLPEEVFLVAYVMLAIVAAVLWLRIPPQPSGTSR